MFGDAWLACLRLPLPPALYRRVLLFLPGNVIPYMTSPVRLADFLTAVYGLGGVQSVLALDALFLLMQVFLGRFCCRGVLAQLMLMLVARGDVAAEVWRYSAYERFFSETERRN